ncbi:hypothetical protein [Paenibacillus sp. LPE1-1-1.1]|uniref:hypothetical protein n=1 Tax=Paenibacillus sp. LPE1-1-1.1 TaxID=3135230 RepID=UPI003431B084
MRHFEDREEGVVFIHDSTVGVVLRETRIIDRSANILPQEAPDIGILSEKLYYAIDFGSRSLLRRVLEEGLLSIAQYYGTERAIKAATSQWISLMLTRLLKMNTITYFDIQDPESLTSDIFKQPISRRCRG